MKTLKVFNSLSGRSLTESDLARHRTAMERARKIATPKGGIEVTAFEINGISCEAVNPDAKPDKDGFLVIPIKKRKKDNPDTPP